jgi:VanZ family protein
MSPLQRPAIWRVAFAGVATAIIVLSLWPGGAGDLAQSDKLAHAIAYATLSACGLLAWPGLAAGAVAVAAAVILGGLLEVAQGFVPGRVRSGADVLANLAGCLAAVAVAYAWHRIGRARIR